MNVLPLAAIGPGEPWPDDRHHRLGELSPLGLWKLVPSQPALPRDEFIQVVSAEGSTRAAANRASKDWEKALGARFDPDPWEVGEVLIGHQSAVV